MYCSNSFLILTFVYQTTLHITLPVNSWVLNFCFDSNSISRYWWWCRLRNCHFQSRQWYNKTRELCIRWSFSSCVSFCKIHMAKPWGILIMLFISCFHNSTVLPGMWLVIDIAVANDEMSYSPPDWTQIQCLVSINIHKFINECQWMHFFRQGGIR